MSSASRRHAESRMAIDESDGLEPAEAPTRRWTSRPPLPTERTLPHEAARAQVPFVDGEGRRENMDEADAIRHAKNEVLLRRYNEHVEASGCWFSRRSPNGYASALMKDAPSR